MHNRINHDQTDKANMTLNKYTLPEFIKLLKSTKLPNEKIKLFLHNLYIDFIDYADIKPLINSFREFLSDFSSDNYSILRDKIVSRINEHEKKNQYSQIITIFLLFIKHLLNENHIQEQMTIYINNLLEIDIDENQNTVFFKQDLRDHINLNSLLKCCVDKKFNFLCLKVYNEIDKNYRQIDEAKKIIENEIKIYHTDFKNEYPSFIVHSNDKYEGNKITFPYFPFQTLKSFLKMDQRKISIELIDKFIIIKEICIGFNQLHEHSIFHLNLNSSSIMINNKKDSYIADFSHDFEYEKYRNQSVSSLYYRHPDLIQNPKNLSIDENLNEDDVDKYTRYDIYSIGVIMYEIVTSTSPIDLFVNKGRDDRIDILTNRYKDFIFSNYNDDNFDSKFGLPGIRRIIEKCMSLCPFNSYSSVNEIIADLNNLKFYKIQENQIKVETRISNATSSEKYECTLSDLVINYYLGNEFSKELIESILYDLNCYKTNYFINEERKDIITLILDSFEFRNLNITEERVLSILKSPIKLNDFFRSIQNDKSILLDFFDNMLLCISNYTDKKPLLKSFEIFLGKNKLSNIDYRKEVIEKIQMSNIFELFSILINQLINQNIIQKQMSIMIKNVNLGDDDQNSSIQKNVFLKDLLNIGDFNSAFKFCVDDKCNFLYQKNYNNIDKELIEKEVKIYHTDFKNEYPSFIVHSNDEYEGNKITFPYFPFQTLKSFLKMDQTKNSIELIDKFIIIKEICIGLNQLHEHSIFHLNLNSSSIMINNKKNSYIANFAFDSKLEQLQTKTTPTIHYRHPDLIKNPKYLTEIKKENDSLTEQYTKYDIYSFGVLMYEIITSTSPIDLFGNRPREKIIDILTNKYKDFLFSKYKDDDFDSKFGLPGIRKIIEKCINTDKTGKTETYSSIKEILSDLNKLEIYNKEQNRTKIEYRINNAENTSTYECILSDLVNNYYLGNEFSKELIKSFLTKFINESFEENDNSDQKVQKITEISDIKDDNIIFEILSSLGFKNNSFTYGDKDLIYDEFFNHIIHENVNKSLDLDFSKLTPHQAKIMSLSILINTNFEINQTDYQIEYQTFTSETKCLTNLIPITSLDKFISKFKRNEMIPIFSYLLAIQISILHSSGLYHGELSLKSIGIYYNTETNTFLPLIIPFYFFYKSKQKSTKQTKPTTTLIIQKSMNELDLGKCQQKDIKKLLKIIENIDEEKIIPTEIFELELINSIVYSLRKFNISNKNAKILSIFNQNCQNLKYSSFQITFQKLHEIFVCTDKTEDTYQIIQHFLITNKSESYLDLYETLTDIYNFFYINKCQQEDKISQSMNETEKIEMMFKIIQETNKEKITEYQNITNSIQNDENIIIYIDSNSISVKKRQTSTTTTTTTENQEITKRQPPNFQLCNFSKEVCQKYFTNINEIYFDICIKIYPNYTQYGFEISFSELLKRMNRSINRKITFNFTENENNLISPEQLTGIVQKHGYILMKDEQNNNIYFIEIKKDD